MILYFSGTGNSKYVADFLADRLSDETISMNDILKYGRETRFCSEKPYVVVAPIYAWRFPRAVESLISTAVFEGSKSLCFVGTMGLNSGSCDQLCKKICEKKGMHFGGFRGVVMPSNYIVTDVMPTKEEAAKKLSSAGSILEEIAASIQKGEMLKKTDRTALPRLMSGAVNAMFYKYAVNSDGYTISDACIGCGKCSAFCPMNNIEIQDGKPIFGNRCMSCYGCLQRCPKQAINIGEKTASRGRYVCTEYEK